MIIRIIFVIIAVALSIIFTLHQPAFYLYPVSTFIIAMALVVSEFYIKRFQRENVTQVFKGLVIGLIFGTLIIGIMKLMGYSLSRFVGIVITVSTAYFGVSVISHLNLGFGFIPAPSTTGLPTESPKVLDTSVIIDGRIADIIDTKFIEGVLVVPKFVLDELQQIADSSDSVKRTRGRRGLDVLNRLKKDKNTLLRITDQDFPEIPDVDSKLVKLAKALNAKVITNDFNLNKVAEIQGITVLNINLLANALKPVVLPGEKMKIVVIKEGKDPGQGIGYLDDGTMVVVDSGKRWVGEEVTVTVTSVLQTPAGRMIFAKYERE